MQPLIDKLLSEARGLWRFRRHALFTAWAVALLGWFAVYAIPDTFQAQARVNVDTKTALQPLLRDIAIDQDVPAQLNLVRQALLGSTSLEGVAHKVGLDRAAQTPQEKQEMLASISARLSIELEPPTTRDSRIPNTFYRISFQDENRATSIAVVDALVNQFVENTMGSDRAGTQKAQRFFQEQLDTYSRRLGEAEERLAEFKRRNVGLVPGTQGDYFQRLQNERAEINRIEAAIVVATSRRGELQRQLSGEMPYVPSAGTATHTPGAAQDTASRIQEAQTRLDDLLLRFTDKHPEVIATKETLEALRQRQKEEIAALRRGDRGAAAVSGASSNPMFQSIQLQLNQTDVELAALRGQLTDHRRVEGELRRVADTAPEVEAEYQRLTRDYDVTRAQYNSMLERLERARVSEDAEQTGVVRFDIIDPPTASLQPIFPNRRLLLAGVLFGALALGVGVAYLMHLMRPVFVSVRNVAELTGVPVYGSVSRAWLEKQKAEIKRGLMRYSAAAAALLVVFIVVEVVQQPASRALRGLLS